MKFAFAFLFPICWFSRRSCGSRGFPALQPNSRHNLPMLWHELEWCEPHGYKRCMPAKRALSELPEWRSSVLAKQLYRQDLAEPILFERALMSGIRHKTLQCSNARMAPGAAGVQIQLVCQEKLGVQIPLTLSATSTSIILSTSPSSTSVLQSSASVLSTSSAQVRLTTSTSSPTPPTPTPAQAIGLATGAKIGIAVGVLVLVVILALCIWMLRRRHVAAKTASRSPVISSHLDARTRHFRNRKRTSPIHPAISKGGIWA
ncbi:hypothetical protein LAWI1_G005073 [Lachnellula willkommii]|uniref:Mid2 domain-containing protein n=1 Tax=Lachnellula willkommii TaxID=215461 RepID=A0A559MHQ0_9HELO|nr:hypothetical protein LAWI1_G005073 [Lachnellula willkommii]